MALGNFNIGDLIQQLQNDPNAITSMANMLAQKAAPPALPPDIPMPQMKPPGMGQPAGGAVPSGPTGLPETPLPPMTPINPQAPASPPSGVDPNYLPPGMMQAGGKGLESLFSGVPGGMASLIKPQGPQYMQAMGGTSVGSGPTVQPMIAPQTASANPLQAMTLAQLMRGG